MGNIGTGRALRRGVALGLAAVAAWGISLTADLGDMGRELAGLEGEPALAASLLAAQMGELPGGETAFKFHQSKYPEDRSRPFAVPLSATDTWLDGELRGI